MIVKRYRQPAEPRQASQIASNLAAPLSFGFMPAYDYSCQTCGARFEVIQSFSDDSLTLCPPADSTASPASCTQPGQGQVSKVFSVPSITFKGDGFYRNDSRSGAKSTTVASGGGDGGGDSNGPDKPGAAKPDSSSSESPGREPAKASSSPSGD